MALILSDFVTLRDRFRSGKFNSLHQLFSKLHELYHVGHTFSGKIYLFIINYIDQLLIRRSKNTKPNYIRQNNNFIRSSSCTNKKIRQTLAGWSSIMKLLFYNKYYHDVIIDELSFLLKNYSYNFDKIKFIVDFLSHGTDLYIYQSNFMNKLYNLLKKTLSDFQIESLVNKYIMLDMKQSHLYFNRHIIQDICRNQQYSKLLNYTFFSFKILDIADLMNCNDESILNHILDHTPELNSPDHFGLHPIHDASRCGHLKLIELLHQRGIDLDTENSNKIRPIHIACMNNHLSLVQYLMNSNVDINAVDEENDKPIHIACQRNYLKIVELIASRYPEQLEESGRFKKRPIHIACIYKHIDIIRFLLGKVNFESEDSNGFRPIHYACQSNNTNIGSIIVSNPDSSLDAVKLLICGSIEYTNVLIKIPSKVNLNCVNNKGEKPIDLTNDKDIQNFIIRKMEIDNQTIFFNKKRFYCDIIIKID